MSIEHANGSLYSGENIEAKWPILEVRFDSAAYFLVIDVDEPGLVDRLIEREDLSELKKYGFKPKTGLHMTVLSYHNAKEISQIVKELPTNERIEKVQAVEDIAQNLDWAWKPTGNLHTFQGRKDKGLKIITHVDCPDFDKFYGAISRLMPLADFKFYPPHITLLKKNGETSPDTPANIGSLAMHRPVLGLIANQEMPRGPAGWHQPEGF